MSHSNPKCKRSGGVRAAALTLVCLTRAALVAFLMLASIFASAARAAASDTSYRLAGIVGDGGEQSIAVIELPDGRQRLVRTGDALGEGHVVEITRIGVRIEFPGEELILRMRGNPRLAAASPAADAAPAADEGDPEDARAEADEQEAVGEGGVLSQQLSMADAASMIESVQGAGHPDGAQQQSTEGLGSRLNALLEIPAEATITEVDGVRVDSPQAALAAIQSSFAQSNGARLTVTGAGALTTVVLAPDSEQ
jgi:hypothetical protein